MMSEAGSGSLCKPPGVTPIGACRRCAVGASVPIELTTRAALGAAEFTV